jgi:hypothetical protein
LYRSAAAFAGLRFVLHQPTFSGKAVFLNTEREDAVARAQEALRRNKSLPGSFLHEALETGPLSSEAQGLDLSVNIAGSGSRSVLHVAELRLVLDHHTALLCDLLLAGSGGVEMDAVFSLGSCRAVGVAVGVRANVLFVGGLSAVLGDGPAFYHKYFVSLDIYCANDRRFNHTPTHIGLLMEFNNGTLATSAHLDFDAGARR